ncbi:centrosomal protein of 295 kDa isoform X3 [Petaurus breviceps papuanus]|uniref:centrosomal protein of 295 kDa isoform X3 n=1 Tax=Petaurus breviceps papuanus TaxID=3040969 RepID=UPI0036D92DCC
MKRKVTKVGNFRFSPNEEALLLKEEYERRRKQRLLQVREQERCIALQIRQEVKQRRDQHLHHLAEELRTEWQKTQEQKIKELEKLYVASLRSVGEGHRGAKENAPDIDRLIKQREKRRQRAEERGQEALKKVKNEKEKRLKQKTWYVETRKKVLLEEKERAAKIASLPPPPSNPFEAVLTLKTCYLPGKGTNLQIKRISTVKINSSSTFHHLDPSNVQVKGISTLKTNTLSNPPTYHHLDPRVISEKDLEQNLQLKQISKITSTTTTTTCSTYNFEPTVEREMEVQQPDPHLAAEEETKRLEELQREAIQERREQLEKAYIRGVHAMRKVHLANSREKIMKELEQLQQEDLARRRQNVAQMPPQVVELPYKRMAIQEDWQRELEFAFEDMYNADRKVKGDLILKLEPEPLPVVPEFIQDEELDLSMEQDYTSETQNQERMEEESPFLTETDTPEAQETHHTSSETALKKLLDRIQSQRSQWANKCTPEDESEMPKIFADGESETLTVETGTIASEEKPLDKSEHTQEQGETKQPTGIGGETFKIQLGTILKEEKSFKNLTESGKKKESSESEISLLDERSILLHPQEEATQVRTVMKRQKEMMRLEQQKQKQVELIRQIEQQRLRLESECLKAQKTQLEYERKNMKERTQQFYLKYMKSYPFMDQWKKEAYTVSQHLIDDAPTIGLKISREDHSRQVIHNYQQHLLQQNRFHRQSIDAARKLLHEYQNMLKQRYPSRSTKSFSSDFVKPKGESLDRKTLAFQASSHLPGVPEPPSLHSLPSYPAITGDSHLLSIEGSERISSYQTAFSYSGSLLTEPSLSSIPSAEPESKFGRIQDLFSTKSQSPQSSSHFISSEDRHFISSDHILSAKESLKTVQEQLNKQRKTLHFSEKTPEELVVHRQTELEEKILSNQTGSSSLVPLFPQHSLTLSSAAEPESGRIQEHFSVRSDSIVPSSHPVMQIIPDRHLSSSENALHQQYNLNTVRKQLNMQKEALHSCLKAQAKLCSHKSASVEEEVPSSQTRSSPFLPLVPQSSLSSSLSAESESRGVQKLFSAKNENTIPSGPPIKQGFQDRPLISEDNLHQQDSLDILKGTQEQLAIQREALLFGQKTEEQNFLKRPAAIEEKKSSTQTGSPLLPLLPELALGSSPSDASESVRIQEFHLTRNETKNSSSYSTPQDRCLTSSKPMLVQQDNWKMNEEQLELQRKLFHLSEKAQKEPKEIFCFTERTQKEPLVQSKIALEERLSPNQTDFSFLPLIPQHSFTSLPSSESGDMQIAGSHPATPNIQIFQKKLLTSSEHILPHKDDLNLHQEQLTIERKALQFSQRAQQKTTLNERFFSGQSDSSFAPSLAEHASSSPPSSYSTILVSQDRISFSGDNQFERDNLETIEEQLNIQRETSHFGQRSQLQYLDYKLDAVEERTSSQTDSSLFLPQFPLPSISTLPLAEAESNSDSGGFQESFLTSGENTFPSSQESIHRFQDKLLASSKHFSAVQDNLKELQKQLNIQKEFFEERQKAQEEWLLQRQSGLKQVQKHEEALKDSLYETQTNKSTPQNVEEAQKTMHFTELFLSQDVGSNHQEEFNHADKSKCDDSELLLEDINPDPNHMGQLQNRELRHRLSKPPVAKIRSGLDLNQHELSAIQEVESPKSGSASVREKRECYREAASRSSSSDLDSSSHEEIINQDRDPVRISISQYLSLGDRSQDSTEASRLQPAKPVYRSSNDASGQAKDVVNENHGLLSHATDLEQKVLVYPGSAFKPKKIVPSIPWPTNDFVSQSHAQELQDDQSSSLTVSSGSFLSNEKSHLNLANSELEQTFPHLHHQLLHALEPRPDLNLSSSLSQSGLSQDLSKTTYPSTPESQDTSESHESATSTTVLRASLHSSLDINLHSAMNRIGVTLDSSQTEDFPKEKMICAVSEESFQPLQPESVPSDSSHSTDLLRIESERPSQNLEEKYPLRKQYEELLTHKRSANFSPSVAVLQSSTFSSSDGLHLFDRMRVPHSTPNDSSSSKGSTKDQMESKKEDLGFEEFSDEMKKSQIEAIAGAQSETNSRRVVREPETYSERSSGSITSEENVEVFRNRTQPLPSSFLETTSGHGIMEEAEPTLISSSDSSVTDSDLENLIREENKGSELKDCFHVKQDSELKEGYSLWKPDLTLTELPEERPSSSFQCPDSFRDFSSAPGSLQEVFVKKNNSFIEQSSQRQKEIKNKAQTSGKSQPKSALEIESKKHPVERKPSEPIINQLKKVNEVKVCFPEDRKIAKALTHQRTLRLYNELAEVKLQKEENSRREAYARNRERAKEFHRETESEYSITEEAEFTDTSSGDIYITDDEGLENCIQEESKMIELESHFQMHEVFCLECNNCYLVWTTPELAVAESSSQLAGNTQALQRLLL